LLVSRESDFDCESHSHCGRRHCKRRMSYMVVRYLIHDHRCCCITWLEHLVDDQWLRGTRSLCHPVAMGPRDRLDGHGAGQTRASLASVLLTVLLADSLIKIWSYHARLQRVDVLSEIWQVGEYSSPSWQRRNLPFHVDD
jgi:hypothetical protein